jgi:hypothetical protein
MTPPLPSPEPPSNRLRPDQVSGPQHVLTDSAPALPEAAAGPLVQMPPTAAPRDLAYTTALVAACQRMWAAPDVAALWRTVVDEALALIGADGAAMVTYTGRFWHTLAARPSDAAPDDSAAASVIEMLFRQGLLQQPISIDNPTAGASWNGLGRRALLVVRIEGCAAAAGPAGMVCHRPGHPVAVCRPSRGIRPSRQSGPGRSYGAWQLEPSGGRTASRRTGPRNLDGPTSAYGRPGLYPAATPVAEHPREASNDSSNGHRDRRYSGLPRRLRPMTPRQLSAKPGEDRRHLLPLCHHADDNERAPREACTPKQVRAAATSHLRSRNPT